MDACAAFDPTGPYVASVLAYADCRALALGAEGYAALGQGSSFGGVLTGLLTIVVALVGYRLLLGAGFALREGLGLALRLGAVLALASQWPAYRALVFDLFTQGPPELAGALLGQSGLAAPGLGGLAARVDGVNAAVADLIHPQAPPPAVQPQPSGGQAAVPQPTPQALHLLPETAQRSVEGATGLVTITALGGLLSARIVAALLLALGPLFLTCLLFPATLGLFAGWLRGLIGAGLAAVAAAAVLALELALVEPQVLALRALVDAGQSIGALPVELYATSATFAAVMLVALAVAFRVAAGLRWPLTAAPVPSAAPRLLSAAAPGFAIPGGNVLNEGPGQPRARAVADALAALDRREGSAAPALSRRVAFSAAAPAARASLPAAPPLGQAGRRTNPRRSASAGRRDGRL
jgi:type IV secretion system protein VirB6